MHRIDGDGHDNNTFTEGDPSLSIPATVVTDNIANAWQEEIATVIENAGFTLLTSGTDTYAQLDTAIKEYIKTGGQVTALTQAIENNQASAADVTVFPVWLRTEVLAMEFMFHILRRTDSSYVLETGRAVISWDSEASAWVISKMTVHDESEVVFSVAATANPDEFKLQYTSDNMAGASYAGNLYITDIKQIRI